MNASQPSAKFAIAAASLLVLVWLAFTTWARPLMLPDEGRYVGIAWEMLRSGDWLTPTLNGLPYFHKPPLFYWITAASLWLFGHHEWAARIAPLLGALLGTGASYAFVRRWSGERAARRGVVVLLAQPIWLIAAQFANLDMLVAGCIVATIVLLAHSVLLADEGKPWHGVLTTAWGMAALGVLAKGLIGFVLPALVVFAWLLVQKRWRRLVGLLWWPGIVVFLALTVPWFVAMQQRFPEFLDYFFVVQHFRRFTDSGFNNVMPFWFYPAVLCLCFLPWLPWMLRAFRPRADLSATQRSVRLLLLIWPAIVVVFFSLPQSKLLGYVLPAIAPLAFIAADGYLSRTSLSGTPARMWCIAAGIGCTLTLGLLNWIAVHPQNSTRPFALVLRDSRQPSEPVVMLDKYYFDLPFYAQLGGPVAIVERWDDPKLHQQDNQRKEIADAGQFDKAAAAKRLLLAAGLPGLLCRSGTTWVLGPSSAGERYPFLQAAADLQHQDGTTLWRVDSSSPSLLNALGCDGKPSSDSPHKVHPPQQ
ncbi:ArnT family glycosyltransferase [Simplicispira psychrophila]|uniref:ArnT family glycosyltransferase n=1 Tax=Simplicispira psychrophila TaxID=80882 RepID=UPI0006895261|nr:glycosyltransferase family 39 protein [Simplicispira psychrophila]